jgi:hypothetical protein
VTAGTSLLAYAVVQTGSHAWGSAATIALLAVAAALIGYFVLHSALRTGLAYIPFGLSILVAAAVAPALVSLAGIRWTTIAGALAALIGFVLLARVPADGRLLADIIVPTVVVGLGGGLMIVPTSIAAMSGVDAARHGVASALLNVSRQLGGALGLAVISTVVASSTARSAALGHGAPTALTAGFHTGFLVSAALVGLSVVTAAGLLSDQGRGQRVNLIELQAG